MANHDPITLGVTIVTDTRVATQIFGISVIIIDNHDGSVEGLEQFSNDPHSGLNQLALAYQAIAMADTLVVPNKWTVDMLRQFSHVPDNLLDDAIDLQVLARRLEPQYKGDGGYGLAACAARLGLERFPYKGSQVFTQQAIRAVKQDALILFAQFLHLTELAPA